MAKATTKVKAYQNNLIWPHRQAVKTSPFHGEVSGSNPLGVTKADFTEHGKVFYFVIFAAIDLKDIFLYNIVIKGKM